MADAAFHVRSIRADQFASDFRKILKECIVINLRSEKIQAAIQEREDCLSSDGFETEFETELDADADDLLRSLMENKAGGPSPIGQLEEYLANLDDSPARCAVIEKNYIDRDFLDDYVSYYSRCYASRPRKCCRVHFFSEDVDPATMGKMILAPDETKTSFGKTIEDIYLGFLVVRPLRKAIVGRTCLKNYKGVEDEGVEGKAEEDKKKRPRDPSLPGRHYPAVSENDASFFGVDLTVKCMPFQEQDHITAACASCALWSAFSVSASRFKNRVPSPSAITALAVENSFSSTRMFPNNGLNVEEMCYAIRKMGLDPVVIELDALRDEMERAYVFRGAVYAYLNLGVSVIAILDVKGKYGYGETDGVHAIAINGYHLSDGSGNNGDREQETAKWLSAMRMDKFYANDDQCCPGAIFKPTLDAGENLKIEAYHGHKDQCLYRTYVPRYLIIPLYHKIHVTFEEVANEVETCIAALSFADGMKSERTSDIQVDITLRESNAFKADFRTDEDVPDPKMTLKFISADFPRFVWCVRINCEGRKQVIILIDTTDSEQGLNIAGVFFYKNPAPENPDRNDIVRLANNAWIRACSRSCPPEIKEAILNHKIIQTLCGRITNRKGNFKKVRERAEKNEAFAQDQYTLAWMHEHAEGTAQNLYEAEQWYLKAANQGYEEAVLNLAGLYDDLAASEGLAQKYKHDKDCRSARKSEGIVNKDQGVEETKDFGPLAIEWYEKLSTGGRYALEAHFRLGEIYKRKNDKIKAFEHYKKAANAEQNCQNGHPRAVFELAKMFEEGVTDADGRVAVKQNASQARDLYAILCKAVEDKTPKAVEGQMLVDKIFVEAIYQCGIATSGEKARGYYEKAAVLGHKEAQYRLGYLYAQGRHYNKTDDWEIDIDVDEAQKWYEQAARQGHEEAMKELAAVQARGKRPTTFKQDLATARAKLNTVRNGLDNLKNEVNALRNR